MGLLSSLFGSGEREKPRRRMMKDADNYWTEAPETKKARIEAEAKRREDEKNQRKVKEVEGSADVKKKGEVDKDFWSKVLRKKKK